MGNGEVKIIVMDRGHVKVGRLYRHPDLAFHWLLKPCRVIRKWGTENGLAELVKGPMKETILDTLHSSTVPFRAVLDIIDVEEEPWKKHL